MPLHFPHTPEGSPSHSRSPRPAQHDLITVYRDPITVPPPLTPPDLAEELSEQLRLTTEALVEGTIILAKEQELRHAAEKRRRKLQCQNTALKAKCAELETMRMALTAAVEVMKKAVEARDVVINGLRKERVLARLGRQEN